ncbi:hypothetical protein E2F47_09920 [Mycobacterium eburneum]|nr:hypothetical protein E2F47_09920 [Mycobacterium eburneum]
MNGKPVVVTPRTTGTISPRRVVLATLLVAIFVSAIVGIVVTTAMGQTTAALAIALVTAAFFCSFAFC